MTSRFASALRGLLVIALPCATIVAIATPPLPLVAKTVIALVFAAALWNPAEAFLLAAGLAPLGALVASVFDVDAYRLTEAILLAFFGGSLLHGWPATTRGPAPPTSASAAAGIFAALVVGSVVGVGWQLSRFPGELGAALQGLAESYYLTDRIGSVDAARLLEGLGLALVTIGLFRRRPALAVQVPAVLAASAVCAAVAALAVWRGVGPADLLQRHAKIGYRVAAHVGDLNAAGSYFGMVLCLTVGMAGRERGTRRAMWLGAGAACALGLWLSASRTALASVGIVMALAAAWVVTRRWNPAPRLAALAAILVVLVAIGALRTRTLEQDPDFHGSSFRIQFTETSARMIAAHPWFGIGVGRYYAESPLFLSPELAYTYKSENAHNNFLQIAAETGIVGFACFALWIAGGLGVAVRALARNPDDWRLAGALAGVLAFLGTCLAGHPLLVAEVACAFWVQFGLVVALGSSTLLNLTAGTAEAVEPAVAETRSAPWAPVAAVGVLLLVSAQAWTLREPHAPAASQAVDGFYGWETAADGVRYRWSEQYASVFVPGDVLRVEIPVRVPKEALGREPMGVTASTPGLGGRFFAGEEWTMISAILEPTIPPTDVNRITLRTDRVWRPADFIAGSTDTRSVGVQVGEYRVVRMR